MTLHPFVSAVAALRFPDTFNPYSDRCTVFDHPHAPQIRAKRLSEIIEKASRQSIDSIWVGRDLGYRGGRRTGLALTDDVNIASHTQRWNLAACRPTKGTAVAERTAAVVWGLLNRIETPIFLWNVFPLHPHEPGEPFTNRQHNSTERRAGEELLSALLKLLKPARIIAIGNEAEKAVVRVGGTLPVFNVRHPSYGGQRQFERQISDLYKLSDLPNLL